jgi:hypothetical protein
LLTREPRPSAAKVYAELEREELRFVETLEKGETLLDELLTSCTRDAGGRKVRHASGRLVRLEQRA